MLLQVAGVLLALLAVFVTQVDIEDRWRDLLALVTGGADGVDNETRQLWLELFVNASVDGDIDVVRRFLDNGSVSVDDVTESGETALHSSALQGRVEMFEFLRSRGADVRRRQRDGSTPLLASSFSGTAEITLRLLELGVPVVASDNGVTPLHGAALTGDEMLVRALLKAGADATHGDYNGITALHAAAYRGHADIVHTLRTVGGASRNVSTEDLSTPLHWACLGAGSPDVVDELLTDERTHEHDAPVSVNARDAHQRTALHWCAERGLNDTVHALLQHGADASLGDEHNMTALFLSFPEQHTSVVKVLLDAGAKGIERPNIDGNTVLHWAAAQGFGQLTERLLNHSRVLMDHRNNVGQTAAHMAAAAGHAAPVQSLLAAGADLRSYDAAGFSVMHYGARANNNYLTLLPASLGQPLNSTTRDGSASTVLHVACTAESPVDEFITSIVELNLAVDARDAHGRTPLHRCTSHLNMVGVDELLQVRWAGRRGGRGGVYFLCLCEHARRTRRLAPTYIWSTTITRVRSTC
jgi:ankyrin repeat protein